MKIRSHLWLFLLAGVFFCGTLYVSTRSRAAQVHKHRVVSRLPRERNEPLRIRAVRVKGVKVFHGQRFLAEDDWLRELIVTIQNRTNKTIVFAAIDIQLPRPKGSEGPIAIHTLEYGNRALLSEKLPTDKQALRIAPGQVADVTLRPRDVSRLGSLLILLTTGYNSSGPERLNLSVGHVIFEDDTAWYAGAPHQRDPSDPSTWINVEQAAALRKSRKLDLVADIDQSKVNNPLTTHGLVDRFTVSSQFPSPSTLNFLLSPVSYTSQPSLSCYAELATTYPGCGTYRWCGAECRFVRDTLSTNPGNYFLAQGSALCESLNCITSEPGQSCDSWRSSTFKNSCTGGGGGGGGRGGGGGSEGGGSCFTDWDCDFGYHCGDGFMCEEDEFIN